MSLGPTKVAVQALQNFRFYMPHPSFIATDGVTVIYYSPSQGRGSGDGEAGSNIVSATCAVYQSDRVTPIATIDGHAVGGAMTYHATGSPDNPALPWWEIVLSGLLVPRPAVGLGTAEPVYITGSLVDMTEAAPPAGWPAPQGFCDLLVVAQ